MHKFTVHQSIGIDLSLTLCRSLPTRNLHAISLLLLFCSMFAPFYVFSSYMENVFVSTFAIPFHYDYKWRWFCTFWPKDFRIFSEVNTNDLEQGKRHSYSVFIKMQYGRQRITLATRTSYHTYGTLTVCQPCLKFASFECFSIYSRL